MDLSIVVPVFNEVDHVQPLAAELTLTMQSMSPVHYEMIFIDDGSNDGTAEALASIAAGNPHVGVIRFRKNFGQSAAIDAGFKHAHGKIVVSMDGDRQNDPADIPRLVDKLNEGFDVVSGCRCPRRDSFSKRAISRGARWLRQCLLDDPTTDSGCTLRAYRRAALEGLHLSGEMHRFVPALLRLRGFRITELNVHHRERQFGKTKYNAQRIPKGLLDMIVVRFWMEYATRPIHIFGGLGLISGLLGVGLLSYLLLVKLVLGEDIGMRPLLTLAVLMVVLGVQFVIFGLLGDIVSKIYYKDSPSYYIDHISPPRQGRDHPQEPT